jgi:hypothetical protein
MRECQDYPTRKMADRLGRLFFKCSRWVAKRTTLHSEVGVEWRMDKDIVARMAAEDRLWLKFTAFCTSVMKSR